MLCLRSKRWILIRGDPGSKPILIRDFPLRAIAVQQCWRPLLERMAATGFVPIQALRSAVPNMPYAKTEIFLDHLVRKALCDCKGIPVLKECPQVSIIIPVRNREKDLVQCLRSLVSLRYPTQRMEIIVVDDASYDGSLQAATQFPVKTIAIKTHKQASYCRNFAGRQARGEILAFIDSDCVADPLWLKELIPGFRDPAVGAVGGMVDSYFENRALDRYEKVKSSLQVSTWHKRSSKRERSFYVPSCNLLIRRHLFLELGGFREDLHVGEDVDLCWRLQDKGLAIEYKPVGKVYHKHRNRLWPFCRRRFQYGTSEPELQQRHPDRAKRIQLPLAEFLFWVLAGASAWLSCLSLLCLAAATIFFQICRSSFRVRQRDIPVRRMAVAGAVIRSTLALLYHLCLFVSRYYLAVCVLLGPLAPAVSAVAITMHVLAGIVQYQIRTPRLNSLAFLAFFSLD
ncbi:MAG: mycofactocin biosynthesis glycosyltransferase MftF, partial [Desulfobacteraceae bacterium]